MRIPLMRLLVLAFIVFLPGTVGAQSDYNDLAVVVSEPIFDSKSLSTARNAYIDGGVMARKEYERQRINELRNLTPSVMAAKEKISNPLYSCYSTYLEIRRLDSRTPDYEGLAKRALAAAPAGYKAYKKEDLDNDDKNAVGALAAKAIWEVGGAIVNSYNLSTELEKYTRHYKTSRLANSKVMAELAAGRTSLGKAKPETNKAVVVASISPSLANTYLNDCIELRNDSGKDLTACSLVVNLSGKWATGLADTDHHFHFVSMWPAGESRFVWYPSRALRGIATNESVDIIENVNVSVYSDQLDTTASLKYSGEKYDQYVKSWAEKYLPGSSFGGRWYNASENFFDPAGFDVTYKGEISSFTVEKVTVEAINGNQSVRIYSPKTRWDSGQSKWICHKDFNSIFPKQVKVIISFPGSSYEHVHIWNR